jgi:hypothetical protein
MPDDSIVDVQLDQKAVDRVSAKLATYDKKGIADRLNRGTLAAMQMLVPSVRNAAPMGPSGNLKRKVKAQKAKGGVGATLTSTDPVRHLVMRGHRIVTPGGRFLGRYSRSNPFIDIAVKPRLEQAIAEVQKALFDG